MVGLPTDNFDKFAGQAIVNGIGSASPLVMLEQGTGTPASTINGLMTKVSKVMIEDTKVFGDPFGNIVKRISDPYGAGIETAGFQTGAANKLRDGSCMPKGTVPLVDQVNYINWSYNNEVKVYDKEVNKSVLTSEEAGKYVAEKLKTPLKTIAQDHYQSWKQILSDVIDGTRAIVSTDHSDGTGSAVTYSPTTIVGYAGLVEKGTIVSPRPVEGTLSIISGPDALLYCQTMQGIAADFAYESDSFNLLGVETFTVGRPVLIIETKTLNAMDVAFVDASTGYKGIPTVTARQFLKTFCDVLEIDVFPNAPTSVAYATYRIAGILLDPDALREVVKYADVESMRCANERATGYNFQGESIMMVWSGANSYCLMALLTGGA